MSEIAKIEPGEISADETITVNKRKLVELLRQNKEYKEAEDKLIGIITRALFNLGFIDEKGNESPTFEGGITGKKIFKIIKDNISISDIIMGNTDELEKKFSFMAEIAPLFREYKARKERNA